MKISKIDLAGRTLEQVFEGIAPEKIACCNWAEEFPYAPEVTFKMFHTGEKLYLRFDVEEQYTAARVAEDNGEVWTDSCCEFFLSLDKELIGCEIINSGVSSNRVTEALLRFDQDVKTFSPDIVLITFGINDCVQYYYSDKTVYTFKNELLELYGLTPENIVKNVKEVIKMK